MRFITDVHRFLQMDNFDENDGNIIEVINIDAGGKSPDAEDTARLDRAGIEAALNGAGDSQTSPQSDGADAARGAAQGKKRSAFKSLIEWIITIAAAVAIAFLINGFVIINSVVPSGSMEDTIMTGSRMIGFRLSYAFSDPERGDIIIFRYPDDESQIFVKRIIGLPGETVEIKGGVTYVDGAAIDEWYLTETPDELDFGPYEVPEDCYFVMGDNRNNSMDARYWTNTYVKRSAILAKAIFVYWPVSDIGLLK